MWIITDSTGIVQDKSSHAVNLSRGYLLAGVPVGNEGCPAWIELSVASRGNPLQKEIKKQCIDLWTWEFQWAGLGVMEGVQQATEGNRNMIALAALVTTGAETPDRLARVATKQLNLTKQALLEQA